VESVRLLVERAAAVRSDFTLSESNASAIVEICRHLDGIPLALELAAARVRTISVDEIAERLADRFHLLTDGHRATLSKHRTLRALIDWSYDHLSDDERMLFRRLSVFAGGWTLRAAESVCVGEHIEEGEVLDLLSHLVGKSLVEVDSDEEQGTRRSRYRLLETVRQYALERLMEAEADGTACQRHRDFFLVLAEEAEPKLDGPDQRAWLTRLEDEHDNLRAALRACKTGDDAEDEVGLRLAGALGLFWEVSGHRSEGQSICAELLAGTDASARSSIRAKALRTAGKLTLLLGDTTEGRSLLEESLAISRELAHRDGIASSLNELGVFASSQGDFVEARDLHTDSLAIRRELGDRHGISNSLMNLGVVARRQGDHAAARSLLEESLAIRRELGDRRGIAMVLANLGNVAHVQHDSAGAHSLYAESLVMFRELGDRHGVANTLNNLGNVAWRQHDYDAARSFYEDGLAITKELGDKRGSGRALQNLGNVDFKKGDHAEARVLYEESLAIDRDLGDKQGIAHLLDNLGIIARNQGLYAEARALFEESLAICRELGDKQGVAESLADLALVALSEGDRAQSRSLCEQSLAVCSELGDTGGIAERLIGLGCVANLEGHANRAIRLFASGHVVAKRIDYSFDPSTLELFESSMSALRARVDDETFTREWSAGQAMDLDRAIEYALGK
jgi:tetratricopeptide (TPR) repeat protein